MIEIPKWTKLSTTIEIPKWTKLFTTIEIPKWTKLSTMIEIPKWIKLSTTIKSSNGHFINMMFTLLTLNVRFIIIKENPHKASDGFIEDQYDARFITLQNMIEEVG